MNSPYITPGLPTANRHQSLINALTGYVAESHKVKASDIKSQSRKDTVKQPRFICMYMLRKFTDLSLREVAGAYSKKSHGTVLNAVEDVEYTMGLTSAKAKYLRNYIKELEKKFITSKYLVS